MLERGNNPRDCYQNKGEISGWPPSMFRSNEHNLNCTKRSICATDNESTEGNTVIPNSVMFPSSCTETLWMYGNCVQSSKKGASKWQKPTQSGAIPFPIVEAKGSVWSDPSESSCLLTPNERVRSWQSYGEEQTFPEPSGHWMAFTLSISPFLIYYNLDERTLKSMKIQLKKRWPLLKLHIELQKKKSRI